MTDENVRHMWSEDELDRALAALNADVPSGDRALTRIRAELMTAAGEPQATEPKRRWRRWVVAAAAVGALIGTALVVPTLGEDPPASAAAATLNAAADKIGASDPVIAPGQYLYHATHTWAMRGFKGGDADGLSYLSELVTEVWVPADRTREWMLRSHTTGKRIWLRGSEADYPRLPKSPQDETVERKAPCGDFVPEPGQRACAVPGSWMNPTPEFFATLPTDSRQLYDRLRKDTADKGTDPDYEVMVYINDAIGTGLVPAKVRANLYRAAALVPGLQITDQHVNLDGRPGIALSIERAGQRTETIIDPETGQYIGQRTVRTEGSSHIPAGTVIGSSAMVTGVAPGMGADPVK
jgi:hypothetical protein